VSEVEPRTLQAIQNLSSINHGPGSAPPPVVELFPPESISSQSNPTQGQAIRDLNVDPQDIDECFALSVLHISFTTSRYLHRDRFFKKNLRYAPVFDTELLPNDCYILSPFLFWTIVAIGARKYAKDPTLILLLSPKVTEMAKTAVFATEKVLPTIQALILLCHWPMPIDTLQKDITPMLAGGLLQLAQNVGLHVFGSAHDFSRVPLRYDHEQRCFRYRLWSICLSICQRYASTMVF